jgi:SAM-dependent methyltransferase
MAEGYVDERTWEGRLSASIEAYERGAQAYADRWADDGADAVAEFLWEVPPGSKVLDAGCGPGRDLVRFLQGGRPVVGIDLTHAFVKMAKQAVAGQRAVNELADSATVMRADVRHIPLPDNSVDAVWCCSVLSHLGPDQAVVALAEFERVARVGAVLHACVKTPEVAGWTRQVPGIDWRWFTGWTPGRFAEALSAAGWRSHRLRPETDSQGVDVSVVALARAYLPDPGGQAAAGS